MITDDELAEHPDPRVQPGICGLTRTVGRFEWICISEPHDTEYRRRSRTGTASGTGAHPERPFGVQAPKADRHLFVRRWPNREG